jgi:hypothetical protein
MTSSGFTGNPHGNLESWKKNDPDGIPQLQGKMIVKIKKVVEKNKERYILISCKNKSSLLLISI